MVTEETLYHKDPATGKPQPIGLGWLDDYMKITGPTEENPFYIADTGASTADMASQVVGSQDFVQMQFMVSLGRCGLKLLLARYSHLDVLHSLSLTNQLFHYPPFTHNTHTLLSSRLWTMHWALTYSLRTGGLRSVHVGAH
jgi:hypothetical protein